MTLPLADTFFVYAIAETSLPDPKSFQSFVPFLKGVFSQWHPTPLQIDDRKFNTAEQWMMFAKACVFADADAANAILKTPDPSLQKRLGQQVRGFDEAVWDQ